MHIVIATLCLYSLMHDVAAPCSRDAGKLLKYSSLLFFTIRYKKQILLLAGNQMSAIKQWQQQAMSLR